MVNLTSFLMIYTFIMLSLIIKELEANEISTLKSLWCILKHNMLFYQSPKCNFLICTRISLYQTTYSFSSRILIWTVNFHISDILYSMLIGILKSVSHANFVFYVETFYARIYLPIL